MLKALALSTALTITLCLPSLAQESWRREPPQGTQVELNSWALKDFSQANRQMQEIFKELLLRSDAAQAEALVNSQRRWLHFRDSEARARARSYEGGSAEPLFKHQSLAETTRLRHLQLQAAVAELRDIQRPLAELELPTWLLSGRTSEAALQYHFGDHNVVNRDSATLLFPNEPERRSLVQWRDQRWRNLAQGREIPALPDFPLGRVEFVSQASEWKLVDFHDGDKYGWALLRHDEVVDQDHGGSATSGFLAANGVPEHLWTRLLGVPGAALELELMAFLKNWDQQSHYTSTRRVGPWIQVGCQDLEHYSLMAKREENGLRMVEVLGGAWLPESITELGVNREDAYRLVLGLDYTP